MDKYYLIFLNVERNVIFLEKEKLVELYDFITEKQMVEGTYRIIKGVKVV